MAKIVNCATIKEIEKLKETMVGSKSNRRVATDVHLDNSLSLVKVQGKMNNSFFNDMIDKVVAFDEENKKLYELLSR